MKKLVLLLLVFAVLIVTPVCAETLTGNLTSTETNERTYSMPRSLIGDVSFSKMVLNTAPTTAGLKSIVIWGISPDVCTFDTGAPSSSTTPITVTYGSNIVGEGTIGYNRLYSWLGSEQPGYQWVNFNTWNISALPATGDVVLNLTYNRSEIYNITHKSKLNPTLTSGQIALAESGVSTSISGNYSYLQTAPFAASYEVTKPSGLGIEGTLYKLGYNSWAAVYDGSSNTMLLSDGTYNDDNLVFNVNADTIYIAVKDSLGYYHNTSVLFEDIPVVPTWTPDPNATPAPGYVRTWFINENGADGSAIPGSSIDLYDVESGIWRNTSPLVNNLAYIDTLPNHTINAYGHADGFTSDSRLGLPALPDGVYHLTLWGYLPTPSSGNVTLIVIVTGQYAGTVEAAQVKVIQEDGKTFITNTNNAGSAYFTVTNSSTVYVTASKSGYQSATTTKETSDFGPDTVRITLLRATVTTEPTLTPGPGGTVPTTIKPGQNPDGSYQPGYSTIEGQNMLNWLAANGMTLVQLCFLVTILALLGVKLGK